MIRVLFVWLQFDDLVWSQPEIIGCPPSPRGFHSAVGKSGTQRIALRCSLSSVHGEVFVESAGKLTASDAGFMLKDEIAVDASILQHTVHSDVHFPSAVCQDCMIVFGGVTDASFQEVCHLPADVASAEYTPLLVACWAEWTEKMRLLIFPAISCRVQMSYTFLTCVPFGGDPLRRVEKTWKRHPKRMQKTGILLV